jgi:hypothetical protein
VAKALSASAGRGCWTDTCGNGDSSQALGERHVAPGEGEIGSPQRVGTVDRETDVETPHRDADEISVGRGRSLLDEVDEGADDLLVPFPIHSIDEHLGDEGVRRPSDSAGTGTIDVDDPAPDQSADELPPEPPLEDARVDRLGDGDELRRVPLGRCEVLDAVGEDLIDVDRHGDHDEAGERGRRAAAHRGEVMPRLGMERRLHAGRLSPVWCRADGEAPASARSLSHGRSRTRRHLDCVMGQERRENRRFPGSAARASRCCLSILGTMRVVDQRPSGQRGG